MATNISTDADPVRVPVNIWHRSSVLHVVQGGGCYRATFHEVTQVWLAVQRMRFARTDQRWMTWYPVIRGIDVRLVQFVSDVLQQPALVSFQLRERADESRGLEWDRRAFLTLVENDVLHRESSQRMLQGRKERGALSEGD